MATVAKDAHNSFKNPIKNFYDFFFRGNTWNFTWITWTYYLELPGIHDVIMTSLDTRPQSPQSPQKVIKVIKSPQSPQIVLKVLK